MAAMADHVLRARACDHHSVVSQVLRGEEIDPTSTSEGFAGACPFGISAHVSTEKCRAFRLAVLPLLLAAMQPAVQ